MHTNNPFPLHQAARYTDLRQAVQLPEDLEEYLSDIMTYDPDICAIYLTGLDSDMEHIETELARVRLAVNINDNELLSLEEDLQLTTQLCELFKQHGLTALIMD